MSTLTIEAFQDEAVDETVYQLILTHELYSDAYGSESGGLYDACNVYFDEAFSPLSHVWIARMGPYPVGVGAIRHTGEDTVFLYVRPEYRRQGIGQRLLEVALASGVEVLAIHTATSSRLYEKFKLPDKFRQCKPPEYENNWIAQV